MGYSEVLCQICGVSFNIGRIRTPLEPRNAAWSQGGLPTRYPDSYVSGAEMHGRNCHRDSGCMFTIRKANDQNRKYEIDAKGRRKLGEKLHDVDDDADEGWNPDENEDTDDEPLEYVSDDGLSGNDDERQRDGDAVMKDVDEPDDELSGQELLRQFWIETLQDHYEEKGRPLFEPSDDPSDPAWFKGPLPSGQPFLNRPTEDEMFPLYYPGLDDASEHGSDASFECTDHPEGSNEWNRAKLDHWHRGKIGYHGGSYQAVDGYRNDDMQPVAYSRRDRRRDVEHIAGTKCEDQNGYSGYEISAEEMRGCQTAQCLVRKPNNGPRFEPLPDDENFEKEGDFFLSGLTDHMPSRDIDNPTMTPARHGCEQPNADNCMWGSDEVYDYAMPFHPPCFEVFKRASLLRHGRVDVGALTSWFSLEAGTSDFDRFPRHRDVRKCRDQWWVHKNGTAYIVANPLFIPSLGDILGAATDQSPDFTPQQRAFGALGSGKGGNDPFALLPVELQFQILDHLPSKDIASLRLTSRVFSELPVSYFQKLILREMPWLWEAWPTAAKSEPPMPYSKWTNMTAHDAGLKERWQSHELAKLTDYVEIVKEEMPELEDQLDADFERCYQEILDAQEKEEAIEQEDRTPFYLAPDKTNYFTLYTLITRHWSELRGLRNRKRIWADCQWILRRVTRYKKQGIVDDKGVVGDLREVIEELNRKEREETRRREEERSVPTQEYSTNVAADWIAESA